MKNAFFTLLSVLFLTTLSYAQKAAPPSEEDVIYQVVEEMPQFPDGMPALQAFLSSHLQYPKEAQNAKRQGTVFISFVVTGQGHVTDVTLLKGIGYGCDEEAVRVARLMPQWNPGRQNGKPVAVRYSLPIKFTL